jgi:hypothetical protein
MCKVTREENTCGVIARFFVRVDLAFMTIIGHSKRTDNVIKKAQARPAAASWPCTSANGALLSYITGPFLSSWTASGRIQPGPTRLKVFV